jgi:hypothetical protein
MKPLQDQHCPLCQRAARFRLADHENQKHFYCDHCSEYRISRRAEKILEESIPEWRTQFSEKAKLAKEDMVWVITLPLGPRQDGVANPALIGSYVLRKDLPS